MKKYAKLLCAVLVLAILCTSLLFVSSAEDAETEAFVKSFEVTDYDNSAINNGKDVALAKVDNNIISGIDTGNATVIGSSNAKTYLRIGQVKGDNPYLIGYAIANKNEQITSNNHIFVQASTASLSDPFTVVGSTAKGYYVVDFDVATHGTLFPGFDVNVVMRRASDGSGYPFSGEIFVGNYIKDTDSWSHVTIIGDIANNVAKIYINGVFVGDSGVAVKTGTDANTLSKDTQVKASGFRIELARNNQTVSVNKGDNVTFDNLCERLYIENGVDLGKALADGDLTDWADYTAGRGGEPLATLAKVDEVEYGNSVSLERVLSTNDAIDVEFMAEPFVPLKIAANAVINTNGMEQSKLFTLVSGCEIKSTNGNIITTTSPFVSNTSDEQMIGDSAAAGIVKNENVKDNIFGYFTFSNFNKINGRGLYKVEDTYTGSAYINEHVYGGTVNDSSNTYNGLYPSGGRIPYVTGVDQHIVIDFDFAMHSSDAEYTSKTVTRTSNMQSAWGSGGSDDISFKDLLANYDRGEFVHITMVLSTDTRDTTIFVNGNYSTTKTGNISNNTNHVFQCLRFGGNSSASVSYDNIAMREIRDSELTAVIAAKDISAWSGNIYDSDYSMEIEPAKVVIDGVAYNNVTEIEKALYGNKETPAVVKILHVFEETITVNCNAKIYTYGQDVKFVDIKGRELVPDANSIIRLDIPYMSVGSEENVEISGGVANSEIFDAIKGKVKGNLFTSFVPSVGNWGMEGYRNASLLTNIENYDVMYRDSAILNSNGAMNGDSAEYVDMKFKATALNGAVGKNEYIVVDFDFGTDRELVDDVFVQLVTSAGDVLNSISLKELDIFSGDMAHITVVYDFTRDVAYAFVNGTYACMAEDVSDGSEIIVDSFRLSSGGKTSPVCLDNVAVRYFAYADAEDQLKSAMDSNRLTNWSDNLYTSEYRISKLPTLAIVTVTENGEEFVKEYGSIDALNKFLSIDADYKKVVVIKCIPATSIKVRTEATVDTNGLDVLLDWNTGLYEFDPGVERYRSTKTGLAYATSKFIYTTVGTAYSFEIINADNCFSNASVAIWAGSISPKGSEVTLSDYDVVFYSYGERMAPISKDVYVEGDKMYTSRWYEVTITGQTSYTTALASEYPVASATQLMKIYWSRASSNSASNYAITDMLCASSIGTDIVFTLYVKKASSLVTDTGRVVNINGTDYMAFDYKLAPHEIDKVINVTFEVKYMNKVYTQQKQICYVDYLRKLLETTDFDKELIVSLLDYANKAHVLLENSEMDSVTELISEYAEYLPAEEIKEASDTSSLSEVIRSASMRLNSTPEFVFRVARGFIGTITFSSNSFDTVSFNVNALDSEEIITLKGLYIYAFAEDITITVTGSATCEGVYNVSTYAHGLENNDFAVALYNYALCAAAYSGDDKNLPVD
jgi:hypothetical protein